MPSIPLASVTLRMVDQMEVTHCSSQSGILGVLKQILYSAYLNKSYAQIDGSLLLILR